MNLFQSFKEKLLSQSSFLLSSLERVLTGRAVLSSGVLEELEEVFLSSDLGVSMTATLLDKIQKEASKKTFRDVREIKEKIWAILVEEVQPYQKELQEEELIVELFVGLNGSGKTTSLAKLGAYWKKKGRKPFLIGADTFRAAAIEQLQAWGKKLCLPVFSQQEGADPGAVVYDGILTARKSGYDCLLIDTAGRMQTKVPLMEQLRKIRRVVEKVIHKEPSDTILVMDASTGQSGIPAAEEFKKAVAVTSLILTKLDGTAKGGVVLSIAKTLNIPLSFLGVGEKEGDLYPFEAKAFLAALLDLASCPQI